MNAELLPKMKEPDSFERSLQNPAHALTLRDRENKEEAWDPPENTDGPYNPLSAVSEFLYSQPVIIVAVLQVFNLQIRTFVFSRTWKVRLKHL